MQNLWCGKARLSLLQRGSPDAAGEIVPTGSCKACLDLYKRQRWEAGAPERAARQAEKEADALRKAALPRICRACGIEKPITEFYAKGVLKSGATRYRPDCITCTVAAVAADPEEKERIRAATAAWRAVDPERGRKCCRDSRNLHGDERRATQRADRKDPVKRPRILATGKRSVAKHKEKRYAETKAHRAANAAHYKAYIQKYWRDNPERAAEYQARRRARKAEVGGHHTSKDIKAIRARQHDKCNNPMCAVDLNGRGAVDHIVALVNGGSNWPDNLQLLCKSCNSKKRSRDNATFLRCFAIEKGLSEPPAEISPEPDDTDVEKAA